MKRSLMAVVVVVSMMALAGIAYAERVPVALTQTLTGYSKGADTVTLEYAVQVHNQGDAALDSLSLSLVPRPPFVMTKSSFVIDHLDPNGKADLAVKVVTSMVREQQFFSQKPLQWAAKYTDSDGRLVEFPIKSMAGGDK